MKSKRYLYGLMGLLSLLGFIGVFTEAKSFLGFFAFVLGNSWFIFLFAFCTFSLNISSSNQMKCWRNT